MARFRSRLAVVVCLVLAAGAMAAVSGATAEPGGYKVNSHGETYGSVADAPSPDGEPDLIRVVATNGREGYVRKVELDRVDGAASNFKSPQEALAWQAANNGASHLVPVYDSDGQTRIGDFLVSGGKR